MEKLILIPELKWQKLKKKTDHTEKTHNSLPPKPPGIPKKHKRLYPKPRVIPKKKTKKDKKNNVG